MSWWVIEAVGKLLDLLFVPYYFFKTLLLCNSVNSRRICAILFLLTPRLNRAPCACTSAFLGPLGPSSICRLDTVRSPGESAMLFFAFPNPCRYTLSSGFAAAWGNGLRYATAFSGVRLLMASATSLSLRGLLCTKLALATTVFIMAGSGTFAGLASGKMTIVSSAFLAVFGIF